MFFFSADDDTVKSLDDSELNNLDDSGVLKKKPRDSLYLRASKILRRNSDHVDIVKNLSIKSPDRRSIRSSIRIYGNENKNNNKESPLIDLKPFDFEEQENESKSENGTGPPRDEPVNGL